MLFKIIKILQIKLIFDLLFPSNKMDASSFPAGRPDDIPYEKLDPVNKEIVNRHFRLAGEIHMWCEITSWLIRQFHHKKAKNRGPQYIVTDNTTKYYYDNYIYKGEEQLTSMDTFPASFQAYLENVLLKEIKTNKFNYVAVYFNHHHKPDALKYSEFNKDDWLLSEGLQMSPSDIEVMEKYKKNFINFLDKCLDILKCFENDTNVGYRYSDIKKERDRIVKVMNKRYV